MNQEVKSRWKFGNASANQASSGSDNNTTRLVVILHDFERFDPLVVQDLFEISRYSAPTLTQSTTLTLSYSLAISRLPLVFILSMTSPPTPSYIHATYPRSTLARLQVRSCSFSTSQDVLHDILLKVKYPTFGSASSLTFQSDFF